MTDILPASPYMLAVAAAERDWLALAGENDRTTGSIIDEMFKASGWSAVGVPKGESDKIPDWCGMAACSWLLRAGMNKDFNTSFLHCLNVEAFFTYGARKNVNPARLDTLVAADDGRWIKIKDWHAQQRASRVWYGADRHKSVALQDLDLRPGDILLIDWSRRGDGADHITMVRSWDGSKLTTFEGNRTGQGPDGKTRREAVVLCSYDLAKASDRALIHGWGRLSPLDFGAGRYK